MSAFGGKADMTVCGCPLSRSLLGVKQTSLFATHMSAYDPKRTSPGPKFAPRALTGYSLIHLTELARGRHAPPVRSRVDASMAAVVSDVLLPHEPQLVQRGHLQRGRQQVYLLRRR